MRKFDEHMVKQVRKGWLAEILGCYIIRYEEKGTFVVPSVGYLYVAVCSPCLKSWSSQTQKKSTNNLD